MQMLNLFHKTLKPLKETCLLPTKIEVKSEPKASFVITSLAFGFKQFCPTFFKLNKSLVGNSEFYTETELCCVAVSFCKTMAYQQRKNTGSLLSSYFKPLCQICYTIF